MSGLLGLVVLVLDVLAIINVFKSSLSTGKKILWVAVILLLPVLGLAIYWFLGRK